MKRYYEGNVMELQLRRSDKQPRAGMSPQRLSVRKHPTSRHLITFYTNQCRVKLKWTLLNIYGRYREKGSLSTTFTFCRTNSRSLLGWPAIWDVREAGSIRSETRVYFYKWFRKLTFLSVYCWQATVTFLSSEWKTKFLLRHFFNRP